jgi:nicotinamide riboside transporter PnuC
VKTQQRILKFVSNCNWLLLVVASIVGFSTFAPPVGIGIAAGGLIVTINFHLLYRTLKKALTPPHIASVKGVIVKYYIRFIITAVIIFFLMASKYVDPFGLIAGLSVVVASLFFATLNELRQFMTKEAG